MNFLILRCALLESLDEIFFRGLWKENLKITEVLRNVF